MAKRAALGGNWTAAGSWALISQSATTGVEYLESESGTTTVTTAYSGCTSAVFSWSSGAPTIDGIGIRLATRTGTTGTISVHLEVATVEVAGTLVTINTADLPVSLASDLNGGWIFFKFSSPVALSNATSYSVAVKTSSGSQVVVHTNGTAGNVSRFLRTTTTGAPVAGDDVAVLGEYTGAGASTTITVTMNETATTDYGAGATSLVTPAIAVCSKGVIRFGVASSTNYNLKVSGNIVIYSGGEFSIGTVGSEIPRTSTATLTMDCVSNVDFGIVVRNLGTFNAQGLSRTSGKNVVSCRLNANSPANDTVLDVDTDTGWLDNDEIAVASTSRTTTESEAGTMNGNATSTQLTVDGFAGTGGGLQFAHLGTTSAVAQAHVILLTRNVVIQGVSTTVATYIDVKPTGNLDLDWVRLKWFGSNTSNKQGVTSTVTTGSFDVRYCSLDRWAASGTVVISASSGFTFSNNVAFITTSSTLFNINVAIASTSWTVSGNVFLASVASGTVFTFADVGGTISNNVAVGGATGFQLSESNTIGVFSGNTAYGGASPGLYINVSGISGTIASMTCWRCSSYGIRIDACGDLIFTSPVVFGCATAGMGQVSGFGRVVLISPVFSGDSSFSQPVGLRLTGVCGEVVATSGDFGTASGIKVAHSTADIGLNSATPVSAFVRVLLNNCKLASTTEVNQQSGMSETSFIASQKHDQTSGNHKTWKKGGTLDLETTITHSGGQSLRMLPISATIKLESSGSEGGFKVAVASGETVTPSVYVCESAAYNGNRCRLIVKRNDAIGITSDTVLDTRTGASDALWEELTGTTVAATDDGVMEFVVDCDGTAATGYVYVDSFTVT